MKTTKARFEVTISEANNQIRIEFAETAMHKNPDYSAIESAPYANDREKQFSIRTLMIAMSRVIQSRVWPEHTEAYREVDSPYGKRFVLEKNLDGTQKYLK